LIGARHYFAVHQLLEERRAGAKISLIHQGRNQTTSSSIEQQDYEIETKGAHAVILILAHLQHKDANANLEKNVHELWAWAQSYGEEQMQQYELIYTSGSDAD
jgi:hypothetical protein